MENLDLINVEQPKKEEKKGGFKMFKFKKFNTKEIMVGAVAVGAVIGGGVMLAKHIIEGEADMEDAKCFAEESGITESINNVSDYVGEKVMEAKESLMG